MANLLSTELAAGAAAGMQDYKQSLHQSLLDTIAQQDAALREREAALRDKEEARLEADSTLRAHEQERTDIEKERDTNYIKGDYFDPGFVARAKKAGVPLAVQSPTPEETARNLEESTTAALGPGGAGPLEPKQMKPMALRFAGTPKERQADIDRERLAAFGRGLPPGSDAAIQTQFQAAGGTGPIVKPPKNDASAFMALDAKGKPISNAVVTSDADGFYINNTPVAKMPGVTVVKRPPEVNPEVQAFREATQGAAQQAREDARLTHAQDTATHELDTWSQTFQSNVGALNTLGVALRQQTIAADKLVAPLLIKATVSGEASGFRMTQAEILQVMTGTKWDQLQAAISLWNPAHPEAFAIPPDLRKDYWKLVKAVRDKAAKTAKSIIDARLAINDAATPADVRTAITGLQREFLEVQMDDTDGSASTDIAGKVQAALDRNQKKK